MDADGNTGFFYSHENVEEIRPLLFGCARVPVKLEIIQTCLEQDAKV